MALVTGLGMVACSSGSNSQGPAQGSEGGACYPNQTCNAGLTCLSNLCVNAGGDGGLDASSDGGGPVADAGGGDASSMDGGGDGGNTGDASDGSSQFDPGSLSGLALWLEGDVGVGSTKWADQSFHHDDFTSTMPVPAAASMLNGHTLLDMTTTGMQGAGTATVGTGPLLVEMVVSHVANGGIFDANETNSQSLRIGAQNPMAAFAGEYVMQSTAVDLVTANVTVGDGAAHILGAQLDGAGNLTLRFDGAAVAGPMTGATLDLGTLPAGLAGAWFAEVIVVSSAVTSQQVGDVEAYLKAKYAL